MGASPIPAPSFVATHREGTERENRGKLAFSLFGSGSKVSGSSNSGIAYLCPVFVSPQLAFTASSTATTLITEARSQLHTVSRTTAVTHFLKPRLHECDTSTWNSVCAWSERDGCASELPRRWRQEVPHPDIHLFSVFRALPTPLVKVTRGEMHGAPLVAPAHPA